MRRGSDGPGFVEPVQHLVYGHPPPPFESPAEPQAFRAERAEQVERGLFSGSVLFGLLRDPLRFIAADESPGRGQESEILGEEVLLGIL